MILDALTIAALRRRVAEQRRMGVHTGHPLTCDEVEALCDALEQRSQPTLPEGATVAPVESVGPCQWASCQEAFTRTGRIRKGASVIVVTIGREQCRLCRAHARLLVGQLEAADALLRT